VRVMVAALLVAFASPVALVPSAADAAQVRENLPGAPQKTREFSDGTTRAAAAILLGGIAVSILWRRFKNRNDGNG